MLEEDHLFVGIVTLDRDGILATSAEQQRKRCMLTASDWPSRVSENGHLVQLSEASLNSILYQSSKVKREK